MREAITLGHDGEATAKRTGFQALTAFQQDDVIQFLKSLQVLPPGTPCLGVDERNQFLRRRMLGQPGVDPMKVLARTTV
jgi:hypothetical protein